MGKCKKTARQHLHPRHPLVRRPHRHHLQLPRVRRNGQILQILCRAIKKAGRGRLPICFFFPPVFVQIPAFCTKRRNEHSLRLFLACRKRGDAAGTPFFASLGGCKCYALAPPPLASGCAYNLRFRIEKQMSTHSVFFLRSGCEFEGRLRIWGRVAGKIPKTY